MSFDSLGLSAELLRAVAEQNYTEPTPIQRKVIPLILQGRDILAGAQTGTGKTAGFALPLLHRLHASPRQGKGVRALILTPTRELAAQVAESVGTYGRHLKQKSTVIFGGVNINPQIDRLRRGVDILIATPGRLLDHVARRTVDLSNVEILVLDEADRMLDMGFIHDVRKVLALLPKNGQRQNLLFSATVTREIKQLADTMLDSPALIEVTRSSSAPELVAQVVYPVDKTRKRELLSYVIGSENWQQVLVFARTKHGADRLAKQLSQDGLKAIAIHGNKSQGQRTRALADFKKGAVRILVATDIAARGLDIDQLPHVVNFDLPNAAEDYVHRIGRTGRAGNEGEAVSLVSADESSMLRDIERLLQRDLPRKVIVGYEPTTAITQAPARKKQSGQVRFQPRKQRAGREQNNGRQPNTGRGRRRSSGNRSVAANR